MAFKHASPQASTCVHRTHTRCGTTVVRVAHITRVHGTVFMHTLGVPSSEECSSILLRWSERQCPYCGWKTSGARTVRVIPYPNFLPRLSNNHPEPQYKNRIRRSNRHTCTRVTHGASMCVGAHVTLYTHPRLRATFEQTCISARAHVRASVRALRHPTPHKGAHTRHSPGTHVSPRYLRTGSGKRAHVRGSVRAPARTTPRSVPSELNKARS